MLPRTGLKITTELTARVPYRADMSREELERKVTEAGNTIIEREADAMVIGRAKGVQIIHTSIQTDE